MSQDAINHPAHYGGDSPTEHIKVVEAWGLNYALGSCTKYICRAGRKANTDPLEDLEKARFWLEHEIERLKQAETRPRTAAEVMRVDSERQFERRMMQGDR